MQILQKKTGISLSLLQATALNKQISFFYKL